MADRYWIATSAGNWSDTANWSDTDGGSGGSSVPTSSDDVYFTSTANGDCTLTATSSAAVLDFTGGTGYTGTISGGTNYIFFYGDVTLNSGMTWDINNIRVYTNGIVITQNGIPFKGLLQLRENITSDGTFIFYGNSVTDRGRIITVATTASSRPARTITASNVDIKHTDFFNIKGAGDSDWDFTSMDEFEDNGDLGENQDITFQNFNCYYVSGAEDGLWSDSTKWMTTSGGSTLRRIPLAQDTAIIDTNSFDGSRNFTQDYWRICKIDFTGSSGVTFITSTECEVWGDIILTDLDTLSDSEEEWNLYHNVDIKSAGHTWNKPLKLINVDQNHNAIFYLLDNFTSNENITLIGASTGGASRAFLYADGYNVTIPYIACNSAGTFERIYFGSGTWRFTGDSNPIVNSKSLSARFEFIPETSTIICEGSYSTERVFTGSSRTWYNFTNNQQGGAGYLKITGNNTWLGTFEIKKGIKQAFAHTQNFRGKIITEENPNERVKIIGSSSFIFDYNSSEQKSQLKYCDIEDIVLPSENTIIALYDDFNRILGTTEGFQTYSNIQGTVELNGNFIYDSKIFALNQDTKDLYTTTTLQNGSYNFFLPKHKRILRFTGATSPSEVNGDYEVNGSHNDWDVFTNGAYWLWWDATDDTWKITDMLGSGTVQFKRVAEHPIGDYVADAGTGSNEKIDYILEEFKYHISAEYTANNFTYYMEFTDVETTTWTPPLDLTNVNVLVVGGGGGCGGHFNSSTGRNAGTGGAGGLIYIENYDISHYTEPITVTVGDGGASGSSTTSRGSNGQNSVFGGLIALGGGGGGGVSARNGNDGGSGGGGGVFSSLLGTGGSATQPVDTDDGENIYLNTGYGNNGASATNSNQGGGGGAGSAGEPRVAGDGFLFLDTFYYARGGLPNSGLDNIPNTGNGGNGPIDFISERGKNGSSGIVIIYQINEEEPYKYYTGESKYNIVAVLDMEW